MSAWQKFFAVPPGNDPTAGWPPASPVAPDVCLETPAIGRLKFGSALEEARVFGKPDSCRRLDENHLELVYAPAGFQLAFEAGRLAYVAFLIGPDEAQPRLPGLRYSTPRTLAGARFSQESTREDLVRALGEAESVDDSEKDETILNFFASGLVLEFELNPSGRLKRWNLFPEEEIPQ